MSSNGLTDRRLCVAADAVSYSKGSDLEQAATQRGLLEVLDSAASSAGLRRLAWQRQAAGDGELAILPADEPEPLVVDRFLHELDAELLRYNAPRQHWARLRLRLAIHFGRLSPAANGFAGPAPIVVSRLVDSVVLHEALRVCPEANLGVLLSSQVFEDTVATLATTLRPERLRRVHISGSPKFEGDAWLLVPGQDVHALPLTGSDHDAPDTQARPDPPAPEPAPVPANLVVNEFHDTVVANDGPTFGIHTGGPA
jgi:hypothetical protein